jgi:hypothetical protein
MSMHTSGIRKILSPSSTTDEVASHLDDMASLAEYWTKNRADGRTPNAIRSAMVQVYQEIAFRYNDARAQWIEAKDKNFNEAEFHAWFTEQMKHKLGK